MQPHSSTTPFGRRSLTLAHVASQAVAKARPPEKAVHKWQVFRAICTAKARIGVSERALAVLDALLSFHPETDAERRRPDRIPIEPAARAARPRHGAGDAAAASGGPGRLRPHHSPRQPERQALRPQRAGRSHRNGVRLRSQPAGGARRGIRGLGRGGSGRGTRAETGARAHHALPARHRQDDRDGHRRGRPNPQGRAGAGRLGGGPQALPRHPRAASALRGARGTGADRRGADAAGRRNPQPVGKSRQISKYKRQ